MTNKRAVTVVLLILALAIAVDTYQTFANSGSISSNAQTGCVIQSRGLSAQKYLTKVMSDIAVLLVPAPGSKVPPVPIFNLLTDLRSNLNSYVSIENKQPASRNCNI